MALPSRNNCSAPASRIELPMPRYFSKLPPELRFKIWGMTIEPRVIEVRSEIDHEGAFFYKYISKIPILLHVGKDSRAEGLRYYELSKAREETSEPGQTPHAINRFYFNVDRDTIDISRTFQNNFNHQGWFINKNECGFFGRVQKLIIARTSFVYLPELREVTLVEQLTCSMGFPCDYTTKHIVEYATLKESLERRRKLTWYAEQSEAISDSEARQFKPKWEKKRGNLPCPMVRIAVVCGKPPSKPDVMIGSARMAQLLDSVFN